MAELCVRRRVRIRVGCRAGRSTSPVAALADTLAAERVRLRKVSRGFRLVMASALSDLSRATCSPQSGIEVLAGFRMKTEKAAPNQSLLPTTVVAVVHEAERLAGRGRVLRSVREMSVVITENVRAGRCAQLHRDCASRLSGSHAPVAMRLGAIGIATARHTVCRSVRASPNQSLLPTTVVARIPRSERWAGRGRACR